MSTTPKNPNVTISELGEKRTFVSGTDNYRIEWAKLNGSTFKVGSKVRWVNHETGNGVRGTIDWLIIIDENDGGEVQVSTNNMSWGRIPLEDLTLVK